MRTIRVALFEMKPRLRDILTDAVAREQDMELIPYEFRPDAAPAAGAPDAVVAQGPDPLDVELPDRLLRTMPRARVVIVAETGDQAAVYELQPARTVMLDVSIEQLVGVIRAGLGYRGGE